MTIRFKNWEGYDPLDPPGYAYVLKEGTSYHRSNAMVFKEITNYDDFVLPSKQNFSASLRNKTCQLLGSRQERSTTLSI